jgi:hypothetical protein
LLQRAFLLLLQHARRRAATCVLACCNTLGCLLQRHALLLYLLRAPVF